MGIYVTTAGLGSVVRRVDAVPPGAPAAPHALSPFLRALRKSATAAVHWRAGEPRPRSPLSLFVLLGPKKWQSLPELIRHLNPAQRKEVEDALHSAFSAYSASQRFFAYRVHATKLLQLFLGLGLRG